MNLYKVLTAINAGKRPIQQVNLSNPPKTYFCVIQTKQQVLLGFDAKIWILKRDCVVHFSPF